MQIFEDDAQKETTEQDVTVTETVLKNENEESFEELLEESTQQTPELFEGDVIVGEIVQITETNIFISYGGKNDAIAEVADYKKKDGTLPFKEGETLKGYIVKKTDQETIVSRSLNKAHVSDYILSDAFERKIPVSGKVQSVIKGGFSVDILGARGFCPMSHMSLNPISSNTEFIGKTFDFEIIDFQDLGRNIVISRRVLLAKEKADKKRETLASLELGSVVPGKVMRITNFGAFVDIGGIEGLLHISQISWNKIVSAAEILQKGDEIEVKIIELSKNKIGLSLKELQEDPFDERVKELEVGMILKGVIISNETFGSFVDIGGGVSALIPISEMAKGRRIKDASEVVNPGDQIEAEIIKLDPVKKKISISLKSLEPDPWDNIEHFVINESVTGTIENINKHGIFVQVSAGLTGLIPKSKLRYAKEKLEEKEIGAQIEVRLVEIDSENQRISLEPAEMDEMPERPAKNTYSNNHNNNQRSGGERSNWKRYAIQKKQDASGNPFQDL